MKVIKKSIKANEVVDVKEPVNSIESTEDTCVISYAPACASIKLAIEQLAENGDDEKSSEAIANLSIVLLDLECE